MKDVAAGAGIMLLVFFVAFLIVPWASKFFTFYFAWVASL